MGDSTNGDSDATCKPGDSSGSASTIMKGIGNGFTSFFGWGDQFNSLGDKDKTEKLQQQADDLQAQIPKLIMACASQQGQIDTELLTAAGVSSEIAINQMKIIQRTLKNGTSIDELIIVMSIGTLMILVLFFSIIR